MPAWTVWRILRRNGCRVLSMRWSPVGVDNEWDKDVDNELDKLGVH